jgi:hypothetical protein
LYQPFASVGRVGDELVICGGVVSYWSENVRGVVFPARSLHEPVTVAEPSSGLEYVFGATQEVRPETPSLPLNETVRAWLYQPFASGWRDGVATTVGPVSSYLNCSVAVSVLPALSVHVPLAAAVALSGPE